MSKWTPTIDILPESGRMVTVFHKGEEYPMWFEHGLFFTPDQAVYVYYTPEYWRY